MTNVFADALKQLAEQSEAAIRREDGDYDKDGLIYCGKCNTPKQARIVLQGVELKPMCMCQCESERYDRETEERRQRERAERMARMRGEAFHDSAMAGWTFEADDGQNPRISQAARKYVEHFKEMREKHKGLLLYGGVGTGKTFIAACIANELLDHGVPCLVTNVNRAVNAMNEQYQYLDGLNAFELIVLDDLAAERETEFMQEQVMQLIDARYRSGLPMIVTTNLTSEQIKHPDTMQKARIYSRLMEMCIPVEVGGKDRRKEKLKADYEEARGLLGL